MIELLATIAFAFIAVVTCTLVLRTIADFFRSEGLGHVNPERKQSGVSFYGNATEGKTVVLYN